MTLVFTNSALDPDGDQLTFSLMPGAPTNATLDGLTGVFSWTPVSSQIGTNTVGIVVTDNGFPVLSATQTFEVTVVASNHPPSLSPVPTQNVYAGITLVWTNSASDPDPGQTLVFSLDPGAPAGARIDPATGVFSWTPTSADVGTNTITVRVTDNGLPPLSATQTFVVHVLSAPVLEITTSNNAAWLSWESIVGSTYQIQFETSLIDSIWVPLMPNITATETNTEFSDPLGTNALRFYRLWVVP